MTARVVFLSAHIKHYRRPFFEQLHKVLGADGIDLRVLYGKPNASHAARLDNVTLPTSYGRQIPSYWFIDRLVYQSAWREIAGADLVITPNEHKLLLNPILLALRAAGMKRVAFWGKGNIVKSKIKDPAEWLRYQTANAVDWWFPYTETTADNLRRNGVRCGITPITNAIDTSKLRREVINLSEECLAHSRYSLGLGRGPVGIFCGNLSANKHLDFLFDAANKVHHAIPDFRLIVVGNGPMREHVEMVASRERYVRFLGPRIGQEKALLLALSDVFLLPGAVGLAVLDSFAAGLPFLTTQVPSHGPEISYLHPGSNGLITEHDTDSFANATVGLLRDPELLAKLRAGALQSGQDYSIENMVENFRRGIVDCLNSGVRHSLSPGEPS